MSLSEPNKLPQGRNSYLISFPRYSDGSFKMEHSVCISSAQKVLEIVK